ncbi:YceI family protein [Lutibacter aestuarii]|uniref:YceI family protein n=1 Tax=Lutibacter aestuarii TaxID=861111 RepID=A0ABW2Z819_9FLAO|nr:YceI family protein [uncultured Lutibacter sp.]
MKKIRILSMLLAITLIYSCKEAPKKEVKKEELSYSIATETSTINWTAFKTTDKVPVKGQFTEFSIENSKKASTPLEALDGIKFKIPVSSLFTKDTIRDGKLKKFFFGVMKNTTFLSGTVHTTNQNTGTVDLNMNGITHTLPITFVLSENNVVINAEMNVDNWQAQEALISLNEACKDLHTGPDGVTKTWSEVKIEVSTNFIQN